jgi:hypothetical protein
MLAAAIITAVATAALAAIAVVQIRAGGKAAEAALAITQKQAEAAIAIARETREAAERQWQPRVFVHAWHGPKPGDGTDAAPGEMAVRYYLSNEGTGPAFNVEHGVRVKGKPHTWDDRQWRNMRAGEFIPALERGGTQPVPPSAIVVGVKLDEWDEDDYVYWARFENLLGDRFEVRNYPDPTRPAEFRRLTDVAAASAGG